MFIYGYIPADATQAVICPTIRDKNGNLSDVTNYIALATVYSKIFEHILLNRFYALHTTSFILNEVIPLLCLSCFWRNYRLLYDFTVTMVTICIRVLDANKAFDTVDYSVLFLKLVSREVPTYILRLLWNWYGHHFARTPVFCGPMYSLRISSSSSSSSSSSYLFQVTRKATKAHWTGLHKTCQIKSSTLVLIFSAILA